MNTGISFFNSVNSAVCRPLLDWQLLTLETTFGLLADKVGGMTFWKQISQAFPPLSLSSTLFFSRCLPSHRIPLPERLEQDMKESRRWVEFLSREEAWHCFILASDTNKKDRKNIRSKLDVDYQIGRSSATNLETQKQTKRIKIHQSESLTF